MIEVAELELKPAGLQKVGRIELADGVIEEIQETLSDLQDSVELLQSSLSTLAGELDAISQTVDALAAVIGTVTPVGENNTVGEILADHETRIAALEGS